MKSVWAYLYDLSDKNLMAEVSMYVCVTTNISIGQGMVVYFFYYFIFTIKENARWIIYSLVIIR